MWCKNCQQDVPAIASAEEQTPRCAKCRCLFGVTLDAPDGGARQRQLLESTKRLEDDWLDKPSLDDWDFDEDLRETQRLVETLGVSSPSQVSTRFDDPHQGRERRSSARAPRERRSFAGRSGTQSSLFAWTMLSIGLMAFVFGGVLLGWSFAMERAELWRLGMPFAMGGQAALIIGLVFQLDSLSKNNRAANETLEDLDSQMDELRHTTSLLSTTHSSPSQSFYLHMADGASPKLLLADLKGQLDLLASRMSDR